MQTTAERQAERRSNLERYAADLAATRAEVTIHLTFEQACAAIAATRRRGDAFAIRFEHDASAALLDVNAAVTAALATAVVDGPAGRTVALRLRASDAKTAMYACRKQRTDAPAGDTIWDDQLEPAAAAIEAALA